MPRRPSPLPPSLPRPVFTTADASAAGVNEHRLRASDLRRLGYGLYAVEDQELSEAALIRAFTQGGAGVVAHGLSAARLWEFPLPSIHASWRSAPKLTPIHLATSSSARRSTSVVRWSRQRFGAAEIAEHSGLLTTNRVRTWLDLASLVPLDALVYAGDHLVRGPRSRFENRSTPHATVDQLRDAIESYLPRHRPRLRDALGLVRVGSDSPAETLIRLAVIRAGLPEPELNIPLRADGVDLGEPDLVWREWKVCVEHDGPHHRTPEQQERDIQRRELREQLGWAEVQTVAADLRSECRRGVRRITDVLHRRGWRREAPPDPATKTEPATETETERYITG